MSTFENPVADADEVQTALRTLAHATRSIDDPRETSAVASLSQSLRQLASFHDRAAKKGVWVAGDSRAGRAATDQCPGSSTARARSCWAKWVAHSGR